MTSTVQFDNSYSRLPPSLYQRQHPEPVREPAGIRVNQALCVQLGIDADWLASPEGVAVVAGNRLPTGADPIATAYAGHQFGHWNPQLGDGRAVLLGEIVSPAGDRFDLQLKGSGRTPFSRAGDGRAPLGPILREYLLSEAMAHCAVPTSRVLAAVSSGEPVMRDRVLPGAVLARVASSHIRIGTLQFFAAREDRESLQALVDHVIARHYPDCQSAVNPVLALFAAVIDRLAALVSHWQALGFVHGVLNTDNMLLCGETIDYGPCAMLDTYRADAVFSSIDHGGRYAYGNQPAIVNWNLAVLARALLPLLDPDVAEAEHLQQLQAALDDYPLLFRRHYLQRMGNKLGLLQPMDGDDTLIESLLALLEEQALDFTLSFRHLTDVAMLAAEAAQRPQGWQPLPAALLRWPAAGADWLHQWQSRQRSENSEQAAVLAVMDAANPALIARNHQVEAAISAAVDGQDLQPFHRLAAALQQPTRWLASDAELLSPPLAEEVVTQTFCGT